MPGLTLLRCGPPFVYNATLATLNPLLVDALGVEGQANALELLAFQHEVYVWVCRGDRGAGRTISMDVGEVQVLDGIEDTLATEKSCIFTCW